MTAAALSGGVGLLLSVAVGAPLLLPALAAALAALLAALLTRRRGASAAHNARMVLAVRENAARRAAVERRLQPLARVAAARERPAQGWYATGGHIRLRGTVLSGPVTRE